MINSVSTINLTKIITNLTHADTRSCCSVRIIKVKYASLSVYSSSSTICLIARISLYLGWTPRMRLNNDWNIVTYARLRGTVINGNPWNNILWCFRIRQYNLLRATTSRHTQTSKSKRRRHDFQKLSTINTFYLGSPRWELAFYPVLESRRFCQIV